MADLEQQVGILRMVLANTRKSLVEMYLNADDLEDPVKKLMDDLGIKKEDTETKGITRFYAGDKTISFHIEE